MTIHRDDSQKKAKKLKTTMTGKHVIVKSLGYGSYLAQALGDESAEVEEVHADNSIAEEDKVDEFTQAQQQAQQAADELVEWEVEEILDESGSLKKGTKE